MRLIYKTILTAASFAQDILNIFSLNTIKYRPEQSDFFDKKYMGHDLLCLTNYTQFYSNEFKLLVSHL